MNKRRGLSLLFITLFLTLSCAIEEFNSVPNLNTPLGLSAVNTVFDDTITNYNIVKIQFWAMNNETYFSGFEIFIAESLSDLTNESNSYRALPNINGETNTGDSNSLTINGTPMTEALQFTYNMHYDTNLTRLAPGMYYIWVKAYSASFTTYSLPSNLTNVNF